MSTNQQFNQIVDFLLPFIYLFPSLGEISTEKNNTKHTHWLRTKRKSISVHVLSPIISLLFVIKFPLFPFLFQWANNYGNSSFWMFTNELRHRLFCIRLRSQNKWKLFQVSHQWSDCVSRFDNFFLNYNFRPQITSGLLSVIWTWLKNWKYFFWIINYTKDLCSDLMLIQNLKAFWKHEVCFLFSYCWCCLFCK